MFHKRRIIFHFLLAFPGIGLYPFPFSYFPNRILGSLLLNRIFQESASEKSGKYLPLRKGQSLKRKPLHQAGADPLYLFQINLDQNGVMVAGPSVHFGKIGIQVNHIHLGHPFQVL